jgi:hypothetical protein
MAGAKKKDVLPEEVEATEPTVATPGFVDVETAPTGEVTATLEYEYHAPDRSEVHLTAGAKDRTGDGDLDGLSDAAERKFGTDPHHYDTDGDGIADGVEVQIGTDPLDKLGDADHDGVPDATEIGQGMNPFDPDTDHDGISDAVEYDRYPFLATVPTPKATDADWDGDGISNEIEDTYGQSRTIPESDVPALKALTDRNYEARLQLNPDPVQQAILAADLQRELTPEQQDAFEDAVFDRGIASADVMERYTFAVQLNVIDGTPVPSDLEASYAKTQADLLQALSQRDLSAWISYNDARGVTLDAAAKDAFVNADLGQLLVDVRTLSSLGVDVSTLGGTNLATSIVAADPELAGDFGMTSSTAVDSTLDRMGDGASDNPAGSDAEPDAPAIDDEPAAPAGPEPAPAPTAGPAATTSPTPTQIADAVGQIADDITAGLGTGMDEDAPPSTRFDVDEAALLGGDISGVGTTTTGTTEDGRTYTQTDLGEAGFKREYDDTGTIQFFDADGTAKGGELDPHTDTTGDDTNPYAGTTDDDADADEADEEDDELDEGDSGEGTAYVTPDADVISPTTLSPVVAAIVGTGSDPTTTDPTGPDVDDGGVAPVLVTTGTATVGLAVPMNPGVVDGNPDDDAVVIGTLPMAVRVGADGPDVIDPDDPLVGSAGEDIDVGNFTPRPSAALVTGDGPDDAFGFDPDPFD